MPVSIPQAILGEGFKPVADLVEEVLQRHPMRCKHLHPAEPGRVYRLPYGLLGELCCECVDELKARYGSNFVLLPESVAEREGVEASRAHRAYELKREGRL